MLLMPARDRGESVIIVN